MTNNVGLYFLPMVGTEEAVGGAASTKISSSKRKLANRLIAWKEREVYRISFFPISIVLIYNKFTFCFLT